MNQLLTRQGVVDYSRLQTTNWIPAVVLQSLEVRDRLRNTLSTQVVIKPSRVQKGGRIEVEYYSNDDLERIVDLIVG